MYLPAETVYYEIACGGTGELQAYALSRRVFPVSPATFHAYLTMIVIGLRGLQIEKHAEEVMAYCGQLVKDFSRFGTTSTSRQAHREREGEVRRLAAAARAVRGAARTGRRRGRAPGLELGEQLRAIDAA